MNEQEKEGMRYIDSAAPFWICGHDWNNDPSPELISKLRDAVKGEEENLIEHCDLSKKELEEFSVNGTYKEGNLYQIAQAVLNSAFSDPLDLEHKHVINVVLTTGGPHCQVSFTLDQNGELESAEAQYQWGETKVTKALFSEEAEQLWEKFSYISEQIKEEQEGRTPGY